METAGQPNDTPTIFDSRGLDRLTNPRVSRTEPTLLESFEERHSRSRNDVLLQAFLWL